MKLILLVIAIALLLALYGALRVSARHRDDWGE